MENQESQVRINKVRKSLANGKCLSIEFYKDGSGASFHFIDPTGYHGLPCDMSMSFGIQEAIEIISGFRFKQHEHICCF